MLSFVIGFLEVFSGYLLFFLLLHHKGDLNHITLMMHMELFSETVYSIIRLTRLSAQEDFTDFVAVKS
jgi:hypothetical protein